MIETAEDEISEHLLCTRTPESVVMGEKNTRRSHGRKKRAFALGQKGSDWWKADRHTRKSLCGEEEKEKDDNSRGMQYV